MKGHILAASAGVCGSLASITGKLIGYRIWFLEGCTATFQKATQEDFCWYTVFVFQIGCFLLTLLLNSVMWTMFVESMQSLGSSEAMVINIGTNILISAFCGWLFFAEKLTFVWWIGATMIVSGNAVLLS